MLAKIGHALLLIGLFAPGFVSAQEVSKAVPAERIAIQFRNGTFELLSRTPIRKVLPPADEFPAEKPSGFWYQLESSEGQLLYRRVINDPIRLVFEGPSQPVIPQRGNASPDRKESIPDERVFSLLIPRPGPGDQLVLYSSPLEPGRQGEPAEEIARFRLRSGIE